jgi:hypothetical protein
MACLGYNINNSFLPGRKKFLQILAVIDICHDFLEDYEIQKRLVSKRYGANYVQCK